MRKFLLSALLASGLTLAGAGAYALDDQPQEPQTQEQMNQGTEIEQEAQDTGATEQSTTEEQSETSSDSATEQSQAQGEEYVVQEGDTLASIAKEKLGSEDKWQSIAEANNIENPDQLRVGQSLIIPSSDDMSSQQQSDFQEQSDFEESKPSEETQPMEQETTSEQNAPAPEEQTPSQNY